MRRFRSSFLFPLVVLFLLVTPPLYAQEESLSIVASHSIAADVIARVAGDDAEVVSLIPRGSDPHSFVPTPASLRLLANADLVFVNGANYEEGLLSVIGAAVDDDKLFVISQCAPALPGGHHHEHDDHDHHEDEHADEHDHEDEDDDHADEDHMDEHDDDHADEHDHEGEDDDHADEDHVDEHDDHHADEHDHEGEDDDHADEDHMDEHDDDHADEHDHEGEDDDHADEDHVDEHDDDHADEDDHEHEDEDDHHEIAIHEDAAERCAQHDAELGERFLKLQDEEASLGPLYAVDCGAMGGCDPHFWLQARNIALWTLTVRDILATHDEAHAEGYFERSEAYLSEIEALEREELLPLIASLPSERRLLVTHHDALGFLARTYGFTELGGVVPGFSTLAEPGVAELAALIDLMRERNLLAIFGETMTSNELVEQVAAETGASVVPLTLETLGEEGSPTGTWTGFMRNIVETIVNALSDGAGG